MESLKYFKRLALLNVNLFAYDAAGCGKSEGVYLSIGS